MLISGVGLAAVAIGLKVGPWRWSLVAIGSLALFAFVYWEERAVDPLIDLRLFRERHFVAGGLVASTFFTLWVVPLAYSVLDLATTELQASDFLDLVSVNGFLASRPYVSVDAALLHQQSLLKTRLNLCVHL